MSLDGWIHGELGGWGTTIRNDPDCRVTASLPQWGMNSLFSLFSPMDAFAPIAPDWTKSAVHAFDFRCPQCGASSRTANKVWLNRRSPVYNPDYTRKWQEFYHCSCGCVWWAGVAIAPRNRKRRSLLPMLPSPSLPTLKTAMSLNSPPFEVSYHVRICKHCWPSLADVTGWRPIRGSAVPHCPWK